MTETTVPIPVAKRADQLVVGDRIQPGYLPAYARSGEGRVMLVDPYEYRDADWVFVAFACADGDRSCAHYLPEGKVEVIPPPVDLGASFDSSQIASSDATPLPASRRYEPHHGAMTDGGLVDETEREVRCAIVSPHEPHRTTFAPIMNIENGRCPGVEVGTAECGCPVRLAPEIRGDAADTLVEHDDSICREREGSVHEPGCDPEYCVVHGQHDAEPAPCWHGEIQPGRDCPGTGPDCGPAF